MGTKNILADALHTVWYCEEHELCDVCVCLPVSLPATEVREVLKHTAKSNQFRQAGAPQPDGEVSRCPSKEVHGLWVMNAV